MEDPNQQDASTRAHESSSIFVPPSIDCNRLFSGDSFSYYSNYPRAITPQDVSSPSTTAPVPDQTPISPSTSSEDDYLVLGVDEAGRGPVLGPMVYSAFYLPQKLHHSLLARDYSFDDSKVLTPAVRANLMQLICTPGNPLFESCGFATKLLSARDISAGMMRPAPGVYNLNAQAMDATVEIIRGIVEVRKINVREVYIDTIGNPAVYQQKLERIFPTLKITVAKKADSLYPCVSAASVAAKVTRDVALELCHAEVSRAQQCEADLEFSSSVSWGSGYPSDSKCVNWMRKNMDPVFGWGNECRFSWGTSKEMLESKTGTTVDWPVEDDENTQFADFLLTSNGSLRGSDQELRDWFGSRTPEIL
ncbi:ribonuclease H-like domain-containing protein [Aspergillus taichungensis]|uniref:Ribonuclease n=1 Tax=Aspergillus taichungensis TaxID=482145 RepID=A0A2J5HL43_9EURO|nr:ribonuclease H-like domain-containing protein [Aspergillus taichungensis]